MFLHILHSALDKVLLFYLIEMVGSTYYLLLSKFSAKKTSGMHWYFLNMFLTFLTYKIITFKLTYKITIQNNQKNNDGAINYSSIFFPIS